MIGDLKPYPDCKESGLPWLGQIPGHWSFERTKWRFRSRKELNTNGDHTNILSLTLRGVVNNNPDDPEGLVPNDYRTYQFFAKGDLVFKLIDLENLRTSRVGLVHEDGIMSAAYVRLAPKVPTNIRYFFYQFYDLYSRGIYNQLGAGVRSTLGPSDLLSVGIVIPPPVEQASIVRFLDWANGRLERAIRAKRAVIALLNEQKQAIIHRAVTRGLDPSVPLKPSGISWLGDIPQRWNTPLFGRLLTRVEQGWSPVAAEGELALDQWAVLTLSAVRRGVFNPFAIKPVSLTANIPTGIEVGDGDVLLTRSNTRDRVGDVCIVRTPRAKTILCDLIYRLQLRARAIIPEFLVYQLMSRVGRGQIERDARGSSGTMPKISQGHIKSWRILLPPIDEQQRIVEGIDADSAPVNATISRLEREIDLLREYRTRLVADVVTGKLDVCEAATLVPEEAIANTAGDDPS